jgi:hypothetical protein
MPATSEDALNSSTDERDSDDQLSPGEEEEEGERGRRRDKTSSTLIDRVVLEKREKFQPSPYAQCYGDHEEDEEWTHLLPRDHRDDDPMTSTGPVSGGSF